MAYGAADAPVGDDIQNPKDEEIVRQIVDGDVNAFEQLVERYRNFVAAIVARHVPFDQVEDTLQDVFLRAYRSLPKYRHDGGFKSWLSVIAARTCYDFWRERYKSREIPMSSLSEQHREWLETTLSDRSSAAFYEHNPEREAREVLDWAIGALSPADRMALELVYLEGRSVKEAAGLMGWSVANVKVRLFRSRRRLQNLCEAAAKERRREG
ncbi:MAG TPA: RNA polymerase sigma factor [Syntrophorhabdaceae bacterium]|jgi:RNA polymerase sigma-70 factor (ECF subfamily)